LERKKQDDDCTPGVAWHLKMRAAGAVGEKSLQEKSKHEKMKPSATPVKG
jgi:hypothetical protein